MGVVPKVTGRCKAALQKLVEQEPRRAGYSFSSWTCADLVHALVKKVFEAVSCETIRVHLHALRYRVLRPVLRIASPDPDYSRKAKQLEKYKNRTSPAPAVAWGMCMGKVVLTITVYSKFAAAHFTAT